MGVYIRGTVDAGSAYVRKTLTFSATYRSLLCQQVLDCIK